MMIELCVSGVHHDDRKWDSPPRIGEDVWVYNYVREDGRKYSGTLKVIAVLWYNDMVAVNLQPLAW